MTPTPKETPAMPLTMPAADCSICDEPIRPDEYAAAHLDQDGRLSHEECCTSCDDAATVCTVEKPAPNPWHLAAEIEEDDVYRLNGPWLVGTVDELDELLHQALAVLHQGPA